MVHECPTCNGRWQSNVWNPQQCPSCGGSLTSTRVVSATELTPIRATKDDLGSVYYEEKPERPGEGRSGADWLFVIAVVCWPISVPVAILAASWFFGIVPLWEALFGEKTHKQNAEAPTTVRDGRGRTMIVNPHEQRAARYEAEGDTAMAQHTRRMYDLLR
jgi:hypothetical protein